MFKKRQIENVSKFLWGLANVMVASGAVAGFMMPNVEVWKILIALILAFGFAVFGFIVDGLADDSPTTDE